MYIWSWGRRLPTLPTGFGSSSTGARRVPTPEGDVDPDGFGDLVDPPDVPADPAMGDRSRIVSSIEFLDRGAEAVASTFG